MADISNHGDRSDARVALAAPAAERGRTADEASASSPIFDQRDAMLRLESVSREIAGRNLLHDVSFELRPGDVVAVLGPSGAGKTSLLRMIAGLDEPTSGTIQLCGMRASVAHKVIVPPEQRSLAMTFQDAALFPHLDVLENVAFGIARGSRRDKLARANAELEQMGLFTMGGRAIGSLSGGEAQRVALARALACEGRLVLLDEPFGNVDRLTRADLVMRLRNRLAQVDGALIVTHDPADAVELANRVMVMRDGRVIAIASFDAIASGAFGTWAASFVTHPPADDLTRRSTRET